MARTINRSVLGSAADRGRVAIEPVQRKPNGHNESSVGEHPAVDVGADLGGEANTPQEMPIGDRERGIRPYRARQGLS